MSLPIFQKVWDFTALNQRIPFVSLNDTTASYLFGLKNYLVATMGGTVVYSSDGVTGPANAADHTDRWLTKANCATRATVAAAAQSFVVILWAGAHVMLDYQGASDDVLRISVSQGALFTPAATGTNQPTATDEQILNTGVSQINATASADRVYSIIATTDKTAFRVAMFRQGTLINLWGIERVSEAPGVTAGVVCSFSSSINVGSSIASAGYVGGSASAANAIGSQIARINGVNIQTGGGIVAFNGSVSATVFATVPELNGAAPLFPIFVGSNVAANTGWIGTRYDMFFAFTNGGVAGDTYDDLAQITRCVMVGYVLIPWDPTKGLVTS